MELIEKLRLQSASARNTNWELCLIAADEIESLRQQLAVAKSNEQATHEANKRMAQQLAECKREREKQFNAAGRYFARCESLIKERDELVAAATQLLNRKRPGESEDDPRLILEIDCLALEEALAKLGYDKTGEQHD